MPKRNGIRRFRPEFRWNLQPSPEMMLLQEQKKFPSLSTCKRWLFQQLLLGHVRPMRHTGNRQSTREITGMVLVHLAFYRAVRPHARIYEVKAYLSNRFPNIPPYSDSQISRAEARLGLSRKKASKTSKHAYTAENILPSREECTGNVAGRLELPMKIPQT